VKRVFDTLADLKRHGVTMLLVDQKCAAARFGSLTAPM